MFIYICVRSRPVGIICTCLTSSEADMEMGDYTIKYRSVGDIGSELEILLFPYQVLDKFYISQMIAES